MLNNKKHAMKTTLLHCLVLLGGSVTAQQHDQAVGRLRGSLTHQNQPSEAEDTDRRLLVHPESDKLDPRLVRLNPGQCSFDVSVRCRVVVLDDGDEENDTSKNNLGIPCAHYVPPPFQGLEPCRETPLTTTLLYNGGNCQQTDHAQELGITCQDGATGSPPTEEGARSYLVVTDAQGQGKTYFEGTIQVGSNHVLDGKGELMQHGFIATIFDAQTKSRQLQKVSYQPSLCSNEKELANRFGGLQIVGYTNKSQGEVSLFGVVEPEYQVFVDVIITGALQNHNLEEVKLSTNFAGSVDLTNKIKQTKSYPLKPIILTVPVDSLDMNQARRNTMLVHMLATHVPSGNKCMDNKFRWFNTGDGV